MKQRTFAPRMPLPEFKKDAGGNVDTPEAKQQPSHEEVRPTAPPISSAGASPAQLATTKNIVAIPVDLIDQNPLAPREVYTAEMILERAEDLRNQGQHDAIHVIPNPERPGRYIICDGWTRVLSCKKHRVKDTLDAEIHEDMTIQEAAWFGYNQNEGRQQHCDLDRAFFYQKLIANGLTAQEVGERTNHSKAAMSYYVALAKLPAEILEIVRKNSTRISAQVGWNLYRVCEKKGEAKALALADRFLAEEQTVRWITQQVQAMLERSPSRKVNRPRKYLRFENGFFKERDNGFELSLDVAEDKREEFGRRLEELVRTVAVAETKAP